MTEETIRILSLAAGITVIIGIYMWSRHRQALLDFLHRRKEFEELGLEECDTPSPIPLQDDEVFDHPIDTKDKFINKARKEPRFSEEEVLPPQEANIQTGGQAGGAPFLIQISIVAGRGYAFHGEKLCNVLLDLDLVHGEMGIFHRYDRQFRNILFSVATLVEPGTFPMDNIENFECPGIILFFQTARVSNPVAVYDDLVQTAHELATRLGGIQWDENRQPLEASKIDQVRTSLQQAHD